MALDPNIGRIKFLRTKTIGRKPSTNDIQEGELALNLTDRTIFSRRGDNIVDLGFGRGGKVEGSITATGDVIANNSTFNKVNSTNYYSAANFKFYTPTSGAQNIVAGGLGVMGEYVNENKIPSNGIYSQGQIKSDSTVTAPSFVGELTGNSSTTTKLKNAVRINNVLFDGTTNITTPGYINLISSDNRTIRPSQLTPDSIGAYFTTLGGMNGVANSEFADLLAINTYRDNTGGLMSGLAFPKSGMQNPIHYRTDYGSATWGVGRRLAYLDDDSTGNSATASRLNKTTRIATVQALTWYRLGKITIPQVGRTCVIRMYGGGGYNGAPNQATSATVIFKTGNGNPTNAGIAMDVVDGTSVPVGVGLLKLDDSNYEIFVQFSGYSTFNCVVEEEDGTTFTWQYASYASLPAGFQAGTVRTMAQVTSNVSSATRLQTPRTINGIAFDGTSDILIQDNHAIRMNNGANFNDYQGPGTYYCDANADADTMPNRPMDGAFSLEVKRAAGVIQKYTHYETARCFVRKFYNTWGPWREIAMLNLANTFTENQVIVSSSIAQLRVSGTNESVVTYNNSARWIDTKVSGGTFGISEAGKWLFYTNGLDEFNVNTNFEVNANKTFVIRGGESSHIQNHINKGGDIKVNAPEATSAIMGALGFNWYSNNYQIGVIRGGSTNSHGFGLTKGNSELLWRVDPQGAMYTGPILGREYIDVQGNSTATQMISRSGRFSAPNSAYHYIDVGQDGRDMTTIGQYSGAFQFLNSGTGTVTFSHAGGAQPVISNRRMIVNGDTWAKELGNLGTGDNAAIETTEVSIPAGTNYGYNAMISGKSQVVGAGYRTNVSFGVYKTGYNTFAGSGAYIAVGGSDAAPNEAYRFLTGGEMSHTSGHIAMASDLWLSTGNVRTNSAELQILTTTGQAKRIATGGLLCSDAYVDASNIPANGIYSKGDIRTPVWIYASRVVADSAQFSASVDIPNAPGGAGNNGIRAGNGDSATYETCNLDIQTHNGLGFKNYVGNRTIVFDTRNGIGNFQGVVNVGSLWSNGNVTAFSDRRLKENITPIDNPMGRLEKLNGVTFTRNDLKDTERTYVGLIAQDVLEAMPEAVDVKEDENSTLGVDYQGLVGLLVETIKDLNKRVKELENK